MDPTMFQNKTLFSAPVIVLIRWTSNRQWVHRLEGFWPVVTFTLFDRCLDPVVLLKLRTIVQPRVRHRVKPHPSAILRQTCGTYDLAVPARKRRVGHHENKNANYCHKQRTKR